MLSFITMAGLWGVIQVSSTTPLNGPVHTPDNKGSSMQVNPLNSGANDM